MQKIFQQLKYWASGNDVVTLAEHTNTVQMDSICKEDEQDDRGPLLSALCSSHAGRGACCCLPAGGQMLPSWHMLSHSQADSLAFPAARTQGSAEWPAQQALCTTFKHAEAWRAASVYVELEFGFTTARRLENVQCRVLAWFMQAGSIGEWMSGIFYISEYTVHNVPWLQILWLYFWVHVALFTSAGFI